MPKLIKKLVVCLPGRQFSGTFLQCWTALVSHLAKKGIQMLLSQKYSSNVYYVRSLCLGGNVLNGKNQKIFGGTEYDAILWIDSDIAFTTEQFDFLLSSLENNEKVDIVSGLYLMDGGTQYATVLNWDEDFFAKHGYFEFLSPKNFNPPRALVKADYTGMGFMMVKNGVYEKIGYPWFRPLWKTIKNCEDFCSEDVAFCHLAKKEGFSIFIDPRVIVGHEKIKILLPE